MLREVSPHDVGGAASSHQPWYSEVVSDDIPMTEHGIAVLPGMQPCQGENCKHRHGNDQCFIDRDHAHHSRVYYEHYGALAAEWRNLEAMQWWTHRCNHDAKHEEFPFNVIAPSAKVMEGCIKEEKELRRLKVAHNQVVSQEAYVSKPDLTHRQRSGALRTIERARGEKKKRLKAIDNIEFLPQEVVTGFLLLISPGHAKNRMYQNRNVILPSLVGVDEIGAVWDLGEQYLGEINQQNEAMKRSRELDEQAYWAAEAAA